MDPISIFIRGFENRKLLRVFFREQDPVSSDNEIDDDEDFVANDDAVYEKKAVNGIEVQNNFQEQDENNPDSLSEVRIVSESLSVKQLTNLMMEDFLRKGHRNDRLFSPSTIIFLKNHYRDNQNGK